MNTIQLMYDHLNWANLRILEEIQRTKDIDEQIPNLFAHILLAEQVWLTRLNGKDSSHIPIWIDASVEKCTELSKLNNNMVNNYLAKLSDSDLDKLVVYKNSKGKEFKNTGREILTHVGLHGHYHRGQINLRLRDSGLEPVNTDFITYRR